VRRAYLENKKIPQLRWMLLQVAEAIATRRRLRERAIGGSSRDHVGNYSLQLLDVGCGRADLTLLVAAQFPELKVIGVDSNEPSLEQAAQRASAAGLENLSLFCGDASSIYKNPPAVDIVMALHACGGLSDVALHIAAAAGASALVCSCCYRKCCKEGSRNFGLGMGESMDLASRWGVDSDDQELLCRLADCERPEFYRPAKHIIGCMRLRAHRHLLTKLAPTGATTAAANVASVSSFSLRCFDESYSPQNLLLSAQIDLDLCQECELAEYSEKLATVEASLTNMKRVL